MKTLTAIAALAAVTTLALASSAYSSRATAQGAFIARFHKVRQIGSTVPVNGDVNPYGVAFVTQTTGRLVAGDTLVSNFNAKSNIQGTGKTIVEVSPKGGRPTLFAHITKLPAGMSCPGGIGLSTALAVLPGGYVVVGSFPSTKGGALPPEKPAGCLIVLSSAGKPVETFTNPNISGPWDMVASGNANEGALYVSNGLTGTTKSKNGTPFSGKCTVVRLDLLFGSGPPELASTTVIGTGFPWLANKPTFILSETGLALGNNGTLYVDETKTNSISAIPNAALRPDAVTAGSSVVAKGGSLNAPLGMTLAPNGDLLVVNGNDGRIIEITPAGKQIATRTLVKNGAGDLFGLEVEPNGKGILFVNDGANALDLDH